MTTTTTSTATPPEAEAHDGATPHCPYHPRCPGCPLLSVPYGRTIARKQDRLRAQLLARHLAAPRDLEVAPAELISGWRARARMVVNHQARSPQELLGFYERGTRALLPIAFCQAHRPVIEAALERCRQALFNSPGLLKVTRFVEARSLDDEHVTLTLCTRGEEDQGALLEELKTWTEGHFAEAPHVTLALRLGGQGASIASGTTLALGQATQHFTLDNGRELVVPPSSFFQHHPEQLRRAHALMRGWLKPSGSAVPSSSSRLVDLYCGVGAHGLALAASPGWLLGMDSDEEAIEAFGLAGASIEGLAIEALVSRDASALAPLSELVSSSDTLIVNPARAGLHPELTDWIGTLRPAHMLYMSCHEGTLARDAVRLARYGVTLERVAMIDMMPFMRPLEALALFTSAEAPKLRPTEDPWQGAYGSPFGHPYRTLSSGISGVVESAGAAPMTTTWLAVVCGKAPRRGELPQGSFKAQIRCERVFVSERVSGVRIVASGLQGDEELRERLRGWGHAVVGDERYGQRKVNRAMRLTHHLDRALLHRLSAEREGEAERRGALDYDWPLHLLELFERDAAR